MVYGDVPTKVARYKTGGYFKLHTDHVDTFNDLVCGGRVGTLMIYLNDLFEGGETEFPNLNVLVEPSVGDALFFHNVKVCLPTIVSAILVTSSAAKRSTCFSLCEW